MAFLGRAARDLDRATSFGPQLVGIQSLIVMAPPVSRSRSTARSRITGNSVPGRGIANCGVSFKSQNLTVCKPKTPLASAIALHKVVVGQGGQNGGNGAFRQPQMGRQLGMAWPIVGPGQRPEETQGFVNRRKALGRRLALHPCGRTPTLHYHGGKPRAG